MEKSESEFMLFLFYIWKCATLLIEEELDWNWDWEESGGGKLAALMPSGFATWAAGAAERE